MLPALKPIVSMNLVAKILEIIGKTNMISMISGAMTSEGLEASNHQKQWKLSWKMLPGKLFPLFPRIVEEIFGTIKMVETVIKTNFFHDLGLQNGLSRGKCWF